MAPASIARTVSMICRRGRSAQAVSSRPPPTLTSSTAIVTPGCEGPKPLHDRGAILGGLSDLEKRAVRHRRGLDVDDLVAVPRAQGDPTGCRHIYFPESHRSIFRNTRARTTLDQT